jgi:hypothetical protein
MDIEKTEEIINFEKNYLELLKEKEDKCYFDIDSGEVFYKIKQNDIEYLEISLKKYLYYSITINKYVDNRYSKKITTIMLEEEDEHYEYFKNLFIKKKEESKNLEIKKQNDFLNSLKDEFNNINNVDKRKVKFKKLKEKIDENKIIKVEPIMIKEGFSLNRKIPNVPKEERSRLNEGCDNNFNFIEWFKNLKKKWKKKILK